MAYAEFQHFLLFSWVWSMSSVEWRIPPSMLRWLSEAPASEPTAVLLRHSVRGPLPPGREGYAVPITETGIALGCKLGAIIRDRLRTLHTSPLPRCIQTAEALREGAGVDLSVHEDAQLGDPGIYVVDGEVAWSNWVEFGHEAVVEHLVSEDFPLPGMADPDPAARFLVKHMLAIAGGVPGFHVFVTHDSLVTATAARLLGKPLGKEDWPWYLEGAFFWHEGDQLVTSYREHSGRRIAIDLIDPDEIGVID